MMFNFSRKSQVQALPLTDTFISTLHYLLYEFDLLLYLLDPRTNTFVFVIYVKQLFV